MILLIPLKLLQEADGDNSYRMNLGPSVAI